MCRDSLIYISEGHSRVRDRWVGVICSNVIFKRVIIFGVGDTQIPYRLDVLKSCTS